MLYESLGDLPKPEERLRLTGGCSRALLPASPGHPSGDPFSRYVRATFQLLEFSRTRRVQEQLR